ncbi:hypothetical protein [Pararhizobium sp. DWP3-4]|uniref:hypothetical protein n=1 Tax=Pararhizobium sp. DWP3-4 TaxID=2804565 RepID=UPI003CED8255
MGVRSRSGGCRERYGVDRIIAHPVDEPGDNRAGSGIVARQRKGLPFGSPCGRAPC